MKVLNRNVCFGDRIIPAGTSVLELSADQAQQAKAYLTDMPGEDVVEIAAPAAGAEAAEVAAVDEAPAAVASRQADKSGEKEIRDALDRAGKQRAGKGKGR